MRYAFYLAAVLGIMPTMATAGEDPDFMEYEAQNEYETEGVYTTSQGRVFIVAGDKVYLRQTQDLNDKRLDLLKKYIDQHDQETLVFNQQ